MKIFKICIVLTVMIQGIEIFRKMVIGQTDFIVEPKHFLMIIIALIGYAIGGYFLIKDK